MPVDLIAADCGSITIYAKLFIALAYVLLLFGGTTLAHP